MSGVEGVFVSCVYATRVMFRYLSELMVARDAQSLFSCLYTRHVCLIVLHLNPHGTGCVGVQRSVVKCGMLTRV